MVFFDAFCFVGVECCLRRYAVTEFDKKMCNVVVLTRKDIHHECD